MSAYFHTLSPFAPLCVRVMQPSEGDAAVLQSASLLIGVFSHAADTRSACFHVIAVLIFYRQCHEVYYDGHVAHSNSNMPLSHCYYNVNKCVS